MDHGVHKYVMLGKMALWHFEELLYKRMRTLVIVRICVQNNSHSEAFQNAATEHGQYFVQLLIIWRVNDFECAVVRLFLVGAMCAL